ncbi:tRNA 4-thiouridine(8) synthase ThiI [Halovenus sp. WSH3]|uniref:Probable tRNA sulfurtransferase n=1 Tax=Halovenus carboxidivorans TaxID=2692199 RepID=A0A6B0T6Y4_9EURY|nr:tRNA sulfurtransferase [Halovenus carboxidivorans]MXR50961.1 tRNA 4-thiouridine(8) synthase ThiI [Halovenus carboxidivorans]
MHPPGAETVLVRYGEIGVKSSQLRGRMEQRLQENLLAVLEDRTIDADVTRENTRLYVHTGTERVDDVIEAVTDTFGVVSASPVRRVDATKEAITEAFAETARTHYEGQPYAVRAHRAGPKSAHPFTSAELKREGGDAVGAVALEKGLEPTVDLDDPELTVSVEVREDDAYVFLDRQSGPGGLPLGTQQPLVALVSGGIDSPVAAWLAMKRGAPVYPLYVDLGAYGGVDHRLRAEETAATLSEYAPNYDTRLRIAPGGDVIESLAAELDLYRMPVVRRFMLRVAEEVAADLDAVGIVTGESVGQKSSQTTANLRVTSAATELPVHRPLLARDKSTISQRAQEIGTYPDSTIDTGCHRLAPDRPATRPPLERVREAEPDDLADRAARVAADRTRLE